MQIIVNDMILDLQTAFENSVDLIPYGKWIMIGYTVTTKYKWASHNSDSSEYNIVIYYIRVNVNNVSWEVNMYLVTMYLEK